MADDIEYDPHVGRNQRVCAKEHGREIETREPTVRSPRHLQNLGVTFSLERIHSDVDAALESREARRGRLTRAKHLQFNKEI